jgi:hypothetical protein
LDLLTPYTHNFELQASTELWLIYKLHSSLLHTIVSSVVSWQRIYNSLTVTAAHYEVFFSANSFLAIILLTANSGDSLNSLSQLPEILVIRVYSLRVAPTENTALSLLRSFACVGMWLTSHCVAMNYSGFQASCHIFLLKFLRELLPPYFGTFDNDDGDLTIPETSINFYLNT